MGRWFTPGFAGTDAARAVREHFKVVDWEGYATCCEAIGRMDLRPIIPGIASPTLVVAGADEPATPVAMAEERSRPRFAATERTWQPQALLESRVSMDYQACRRAKSAKRRQSAGRLLTSRFVTPSRSRTAAAPPRTRAREEQARAQRRELQTLDRRPVLAGAVGRPTPIRWWPRSSLHPPRLPESSGPGLRAAPRRGASCRGGGLTELQSEVRGFSNL
jgi:hypothetical protein